MKGQQSEMTNIIEIRIKDFIDSIRPPSDIRDKLDIGYSFQNNSLQIFEIRPRWDNPEVTIKSPVIKTKYIKSQGIWKIYWMRASGKWVLYDPVPEVDDLEIFFSVLKNDENGCFWG